MKSCFGYIRVSTQKQGEGVSLEAQKDAITAFASRNELTITQWFEEKETAAKSGRPVFTGMLKQLKQGQAEGLIMHKIDRSARNHRDWADIGDLSDAGIDIHFATESLDFRSRGGRLTADIQAVIAADYIRNLREECIKGMNGRLKQGLYPFRAPLGYLDNGGGKPKTICPKTGPLVQRVFELYASRQYSYLALLDEIHAQGLQNVRGGKLTLNGLSKLLQNPFYVGLIRVQTTGNTYQGIHEPLIDLATWKRVQTVREGRSGPKVTRHNHLFQGLFRCGLCNKPMVPEKQKGNVYYRCKTRCCLTKTIREEVLDQAVRQELQQLELSVYAADRTPDNASELLAPVEKQREALELQIRDNERRLDRLEDLLLDEAVSLSGFNRKREQLQLRIVEMRERLEELPDPTAIVAQQAKLAELQKSLVFLYENADRAEKRILVENVWPNRIVSGKEPCFEPYSWVTQNNTGSCVTEGAHERDRDRTLINLLHELTARNEISDD